MATKQQIDQCLAALAVAYPYYDKQQANPDFARQIFHRILRDVDGALLEAAAMQWLSTARPFHPSPGELRDLTLSMVTRNEPSADEAWIEVIDAIHRIGSYGLPVWSNERIGQTIRAFGWKDLCATDNDQMPFIRAQFMKIYAAQQARQHDDRLMLTETRQKIDALIEQTAKRLTTGRND
jgi:hypothetical protein